MRFRLHAGVAIAALPILANTVLAQFTVSPAATSGYLAPPSLTALTVQADVVALGKVVEIFKDTVKANPFRGAPPTRPGAQEDRRIEYKIAVVKIEESLIGGRGLTQFRVGFPDDSAPPALRPLPVGGSALAVGLEGCYFLTPHHEGDFYILSSAMIDKKDKDYGKKIGDVMKVAKAISDPVAALKAKDLGERFQAAQMILQRYQRNRSGRPATREPIPAEENKLILALLAELPWQPNTVKVGKGGTVTVGAAPPSAAPSRSDLWHMIGAQEAGFRQPTLPKSGVTPADYNKLLDEATAAFLKDNMDKIRIKGYLK